MVYQSVRSLPRLSGGGRSPAGATVLLTGASGLVGQALLSELRGREIVCLTHRTPVSDGGTVSVRGDLTQRHFGLSDLDYRALAGRVDAVIHCAAVTDFGRRDGSLEAT